MSSSVHIVLASDARYLPGLEVTRTTMRAACSEPGRLVFHVFDRIEDSQICRLSNHQAIDSLPLWNGSRMTYLRLWLPLLLPDVDWVVYSDVDTVWNRDVCELWDAVAVENSEQPIFWVRDMASMRQDAAEWVGRASAGEGFAFDWSRYACAGVCVMNLRKMRAMDVTRRVLDLYAKYGVPKFPDQDVLNVIFNRDGALLPSVWNTMGDCTNLPPEGERCVYHLTGVGRHFHDATPPTYPPQYVLWWRARGADAGRTPFAYRILAILWPLHPLARLLPLRLGERIVRQWFFARALADFDKLHHVS